jgi:hypothetical protein
MSFHEPQGWRRGELLSQRRTGEGFEFSRAEVFIAPPKPNEESQDVRSVAFDNALDAQAFIGWWYAPASVQATESATQADPAPVYSWADRQLKTHGMPLGSKR